MQTHEKVLLAGGGIAVCSILYLMFRMEHNAQLAAASAQQSSDAGQQTPNIDDMLSMYSLASVPSYSGAGTTTTAVDTSSTLDGDIPTGEATLLSNIFGTFAQSLASTTNTANSGVSQLIPVSTVTPSIVIGNEDDNNSPISSDPVTVSGPIQIGKPIIDPVLQTIAITGDATGSTAVQGIAPTGAANAGSVVQSHLMKSNLPFDVEAT